MYGLDIERFLLCQCMSCDEHILAHETFTYYLQNFSEGTREKLEISQSGNRYMGAVNNTTSISNDVYRG